MGGCNLLTQRPQFFLDLFFPRPAADSITACQHAFDVAVENRKMLTQRERKDRACGRTSNAGQGGNFIKGLREGAAMQRRHLLSDFM
ncbi:hypothetical protein D3C76_1717550 [compost metagenome]